MRKLLSMLSVLLVLSLLTSLVAFAENDPGSEEPAAEQTFAMTPNDIIAMSNYMNDGGFEKTGKWILRWAFSDHNLRLKSINTKSGEYSIISSGTEWPRYLVPDDYWVTYLVKNGSASSIKRTRVTGGDEKVLITTADLEQKGVIAYFLEYGGYYYFSVVDESSSPNTGTFYRMNKDGTNIKPILEKAVYYPYILNDKIYFQDDVDDCRLHVCNLDGSDDQVFIDDFCFDYVCDGKAFYYDSYNGKVEWDDKHNATNTKDLTRALKIYHIDTGITDVIEEAQPHAIAFNGQCVYYQDMGDSDRLYSYNVNTGAIEPMSFETYMGEMLFVNNDTMLCINRDSKGYVEDGILLVNLDGSGCSLYD